MTLYTQEMLDQGLLASGAFYATYAHTPAHVERILGAVDRAFGRIRAALDAGPVADALRGPVAHEGFRRLA